MLLVCVKIFKYHYRIFLQRSRGMPWFVHLSKLCYVIIVKGDWRWNGYLFLCGKLLWFILSYFKLSETSLKKDWKKSKERMCRNFQLTISSHQIRVGLFSERRKTKELLRRSLVRELTCANAQKSPDSRAPTSKYQPLSHSLGVLYSIKQNILFCNHVQENCRSCSWLNRNSA